MLFSGGTSVPMPTMQPRCHFDGTAEYNRNSLLVASLNSFFVIFLKLKKNIISDKISIIKASFGKKNLEKKEFCNDPNHNLGAVQQ